MAGSALSWTFEMLDKLSQPAGGMATAIDKVVAKLDASAAATDRAQKGLDGTGAAMVRQAKIRESVIASLNARSQKLFKQDVNSALDKALGGEKNPLVKINTDLGEIKSKAAGFGVDWLGLGKAALAGGALAGAFSFGVLPAAKAVWSVIEGVKDTLWSAVTFGEKLWKKAIKKERADVGMKTVLGEEEYKNVGKYLNQIAKDSAFLPGDLKAAARELSIAGMSGGRLEEALAASQDFAVMLGVPLSDATEKITKLFQKGELAPKMLMGLGLKSKDVEDRLGQLLGMTPEAAKKALASGKVHGSWAMKAVFQELEKKQKGALGSTAQKAGGTIESLIEKITNLPERYIAALSGSVGSSKAFAGFRETLQKVNDILDPTSELGQRALDKISKLVGWLTDFLLGDALKDGPAMLAGLESVLNTVVDAMPMFIEYAKIAAQVVKDLVGAFGEASNLTPIFDLLVAQGKGRGELARWEAHKKGKSTAEGMAAGIAAGAGEVSAASERLASTSADAVASTLDMHSPSRVFARMGQNAAAGFAEGVDDGSGMVTASLADMAAPPMAEFSSRGTVVSIGDVSVNVTVDGTGKDAGDVAREVADQLAAKLPSILCTPFDMLAAEGGTA